MIPHNFILSIQRSSRERLNYQFIESLVSLFLQILKLILDSDVEWFTIEKDGEEN